MKIVYILVLLLGITSCEFLDRRPLDKISDDVVWNDVNLVNANLAILYASTPFFYNENSNLCLMQDFMAGDVLIENAPYSWVNGELSETGGVIEHWAYDKIYELNTFIQKIESSTIEPSIVQARIAEARFLRAFHYFEMVKRYGGVPIITKPQTPDLSKEELFVKRNSEKEVYDFIASECDEIATILPEVATEYGRVTKYATLALKSRAMLYAGSIAQFGKLQLNGLLGFNLSESKNYWQASYDASKKIVNSAKFQLYDKESDKSYNFQRIFLDEKNCETIFSKVYNGLGKVGHSYDYYHYPAGFNKFWGGNAYPFLEIVNKYDYLDGKSGNLDATALDGKEFDMNELFGNRDPRLYGSILYAESKFRNGSLLCHNGTYVNGVLNTSNQILGTYNNSNWFARCPANQNRITGFAIKKYINEAEEQVQKNESHIDYIVYRYAETLLNLAEAAFELGKENEALEYINQIRERAGIYKYTSITRELIRKERALELAFEGHRFWDLRRWRIAVEELSKKRNGIELNFNWDTKKYEVKIINADSGDRNFAEKHYYLPITMKRISNNPNLSPENPGYK
ncbi:MAG: RagB/SusD family nutrient uptake outer membrane protein [Bacteroides sp.]|uniref:RagB/SusD family nutrient uptake outer membrane protein n=1 Tax=Bacteroides sp. TaxID=29523 RepID=UPI002FC74FA6